MRVFVTGGGGFVGRHLAPALRAAGHDVEAPASAEVDLLRDGALAAAAGGPYERIYHLAAWTRAGRFCQERGGEQWVVNSRINANVLDWWRTGQPQAKLVAFGTSASYAGSGVHREADYLEGVPPPDYAAYAWTKRMLLVGQAELGRQYGLEWLHLVPSAVYGPGYHTDGRPLHFVYDLARKILRGRDRGEEVVLWGDGSQRRELVHVDDLVGATVALADRADGEVVNVGAGEDHSIREIAERLCSLAGYPFERVRFDTGGFVGARAKVLSTDRLVELLGPRSTVPLEEGLAQVLAWAEQNLDALG
ncbi:MAG: NAD-dependent epimerase/dehydratase family protein [Actinomycetota bacterium]|nr:NAD-dependent epimerase/dehydratase family protein [Actinomycetota bacterium]